MKARRWLRVLLFALVAVVTLAALALAIENYRGRRAWEAYRAQLESKGEVLDWMRLVPAAVPDDQNFAMTPLLAPFTETVMDPQTRQPSYRDTNACARLEKELAWTQHLPAVAGGWREGTPVDLRSWQVALRGQTNASEAVLQAMAGRPRGAPVEDLQFILAQQQAVLKELREAVGRPGVNFKIRYEDGLGLLLPKFSLFKGMARLFQVSALVELAAGNTDAACAEIVVLLELSRKTSSEPLLIATLVRQAVTQLALEPVWEGLVRHQWQEAHLRRIEAALERANLVADAHRCLVGERSFMLAILGGGSEPGGKEGPAGSVEARLLRRYPSGWRHQNQLAIARMFHEAILPAYRPDGPSVDLAASEAVRDEWKIRGDWTRKRVWHPYRIFAQLLMPAIEGVATKTARNQAVVSQARVACVLERHRLTRGQYPLSLEALCPQFADRLPPDPVNGQPFRYRCVPEGYVLYSIGEDLVDDQGAPVAKERGTSPGTRQAKGDRVWLGHEKAAGPAGALGRDAAAAQPPGLDQTP